MSNNLDILAITESWLTGDHRDDHAIADLTSTLPDYNLHHIPRKNRAGGGVCVCLRKSFKINMSTIKEYDSFQYIDLAITSRCQTPLRLIVLYRPQKTECKQNTAPIFFREFPSFFEEIATTRNNLLITGDFNFHVNDPADREASLFLDLIDSAGLKQFVTVPTHIKGNTLDLIITRSTDNFVSNVSATNFLPSDHAAVLCSLDIVRPETTKMEIRIRKLRDIDLNTFRNDILQSSLYTSPSPDLDKLIAQYENVLLKLKDKHAPLITRTVKCRPNAPWYNEQLRDLKQKLRRLERRWLSSKLEIDKQCFKELSNQYHEMINQAKLDYHKMQFENCNSKQLFQQVEKLSKPKTSKVLPSEIPNDPLVERFSSFFAEKIQRIKANLEESPPSHLSVQTSYSCTSTLSELAMVSEESVKEIIMKSPSSSCTLDPIPTWLLKNV
ncbi:uncharacterized protein [Amphiura filiformis]|uniref:uncharacterized protein n=1 Tax=Amphiura filiformis TaxID=82378 RepID=UPI003B20D111